MKQAMSRFWIIGTDGKPSLSATFATIAFFVTTFVYLTSAVEKIGPLSFRAFNAEAVAAYLVPVLGLYFGRRATMSSENKVKATLTSSLDAITPNSQQPSVL